MPGDLRKNLRVATIVYWIMLVYIIAALVWWAFLLLQQNEEIYNLQKQVQATDSGLAQPVSPGIEEQKKRNAAKFLGEGFFFLLLILIGAVYIYRAVKRQFRLQQQQRNFLMAVTHELKTPIAISRLNLETLRKYSLDEEKRSKMMQVTLQEILRLDTLINNILIASQLDGDAYKVSREEVNLSDLVNDVVHQFSDRYADRKIEVDVEEKLVITGDPVLLKLLVSNLLENANKYSPKESPVIIRLGRTEKGSVMEVLDEGPGIADDEKEHVFEKFYRIGNESTRKTQGTGLGLYLCKKIAEDHKGEVELKDNAPRGSRFTVRFPA